MAVKPFLDTNVLLYVFTADDSRNEQAASLIASGGVVSVQVLNEFVEMSRRKLRREWDEVMRSARRSRRIP